MSEHRKDAPCSGSVSDKSTAHMLHAFVSLLNAGGAYIG